jgi:group I intron endonuclease
VNCGVYKITSPCGGVYIGSSSNLRSRFVAHKSAIRCGRQKNSGLKNAAEKYGIDALVFEVLVICAPKDLLMYEQIFMDELKPSFNVAKKAGSQIGMRWNDRQREAIMKSLVGVPKSKEHAAKVGAANKGKKRTAESRLRMSAAKLARRPVFVGPPDMRTKSQKISNSKKGIKLNLSEEQKQRRSEIMRERHAKRRANESA